MAKKKQVTKSKVQETISNRSAALSAFAADMDKKYGAGTIQLANNDSPKNIGSISTGSLLLDHELGIGGVPRGRIIEVMGPESSGKTTLALSIISEAQKSGSLVAFIDVEHALDQSYAKKLGVNLNEMMISQPNSAEQALNLLEDIITSKLTEVVVLDSVAALCPQKEIDGDIGDSSIGVVARLMSQAMRKLAALAEKNNVTVIFINQLRDKIGVMFGSPETTPGGNALKFYSSVRLDTRRIEAISEGTGDNIKQLGHKMRITVKKNKVGPPGSKVIVPLIYGKGFDRLSEVYGICKAYDILDVRGAHHYFEGEKYAASAAEMKTVLETNKDLYDKLANLAIAALKGASASVASDEIEEAGDVIDAG